jgi:hypothetical protein
MGNTVLIMGESGTGKSTSIRNLIAEETFIINVIDKPLPFRGFKKNYIQSSGVGMKGNYCALDTSDNILKVIKNVNEGREDIKSIIIDDFQYIMCNEFMRRSSERGYEKFTEIGRNAWLILNQISKCRENLDIFVLSHTEHADGRLKCKTIGKMLDDKITIEGMFTIVFHSLIIDGQYKFLTANDGTHIAKSPLGMFEDKFIDNDLADIKIQMAKYFEEDVNA